AFYRMEAVIFYVAGACSCGNPDSPLTVLEERSRLAVRKSCSGDLVHAGTPSRLALAINRKPAVVPAIQRIERGEPDASFLSAQSRHNDVIRQPLLRGESGHGVIVKPVQPAHSRDPNIALPVFKHPPDLISRETVGPPVCIGPTLVNVDEA